MGIDAIALAAAASKSGDAGLDTGNSQKARISELQRLKQSIQNMEDDYRIKAHSSGCGGTSIRMKLNEFDNLISKVDQQISQLQKEQKHADETGKSGPKRIGVSTLQYKTDATMVALRNSGESVHSAIAKTTKAQISKAETSAEQRQAEQEVKEKSESDSSESEDQQPGALNMLV
jgi:hypothetical protein